MKFPRGTVLRWTPKALNTKTQGSSQRDPDDRMVVLSPNEVMFVYNGVIEQLDMYKRKDSYVVSCGRVENVWHRLRVDAAEVKRCGAESLVSEFKLIVTAKYEGRGSTKNAELNPAIKVLKLKEDLRLAEEDLRNADAANKLEKFREERAAALALKETERIKEEQILQTRLVGSVVKEVHYDNAYEGSITLVFASDVSITFTASGDDATYLGWTVNDGLKPFNA